VAVLLKNSINALVADGLTLTQSMLDGKLAVRADAAKHQGDFRKVIEGFNISLDNVIKPLNMSAEYMDRISKGDIPPKITEAYQGDFNEVKNNLNVCIEAIGRLVADGLTLTHSMLEGKLAARADAAKHQGDFRKVIEGFNVSLDNVIKPLNMSASTWTDLEGRYPAKITEAYQGDFNEVKNNLNVCIEASPGGDRRRHADQSHAGRQTGGAGRRGQAPGRFPQGHRGLQRIARQRDQAVERHRRVHGPHFEGRYYRPRSRTPTPGTSTRSRTT